MCFLYAARSSLERDLYSSFVRLPTIPESVDGEAASSAALGFDLGFFFFLSPLPDAATLIALGMVLWS